MKQIYSIVFNPNIKVDITPKMEEELNNGKGSTEPPKEVSK